MGRVSIRESKAFNFDESIMEALGGILKQPPF